MAAGMEYSMSSNCSTLIQRCYRTNLSVIPISGTFPNSLDGYLAFEEPDDLSEDKIWRIGYDIAMVSNSK